MMVQGKPKIIGEDVTVRTVMETVVKDRPYYRRSGGGLTLSGGESLCQADFAAALLRAAKEAGHASPMQVPAAVLLPRRGSVRFVVSVAMSNMVSSIHQADRKSSALAALSKRCSVYYRSPLSATCATNGGVSQDLGELR